MRLNPILLNPSISIIIPVYNRPDELLELLQSLCLQSQKPMDVVVVDDGSFPALNPDSYHSLSDLSIQWIHQANRGAAAAKNTGAKHAQGDYLVFLDSDTIAPVDYIQHIKTHLTQSPIDFFGGPDAANENFNSWQKAISFAMTSFISTGGIRGQSEALSKFQPRSYNMGIKKSAFEQLGGFKPIRFGEDVDLSLRLWENGFQSHLISNAWVYHKRRNTIRSFFNQVHSFGQTRPILDVWHPTYAKWTFKMPALWSMGLILSLLMAYWIALPLLLYWVYGMVVFGVAYKTHDLQTAIQCVLSTHIQLGGYGLGYIRSWSKLHLWKKSPASAFPKMFINP